MKDNRMQKRNEKVAMENFTTIEVNDFDELIVTFDDGDFMVEVPLDARQVLNHLREFFNDKEYKNE